MPAPFTARFLRLVPLAALLAGTPAIAHDLTDLVEAPKTAAALHIGNFPALREAWEKGPVGRTWEDPEVKAFFAPLRAKMEEGDLDDEVRKATGLGLKEFLDLAEGGVLATLSTPYKSKIGERDITEFPLLFAVEVGGNAEKVTELMEKAVAKFIEGGGSRAEETHAGAVVHLETPPEDATDSFRSGFSHPLVWTVHEGVLLVGDHKAALLAALDGLDGRAPSDSLAGSPGYQAMRARATDAQASVYINWSAVMPFIEATTKAATDATADAPKVSFLGATPGTVVQALGLDVLEDIWVAGRLGESETVVDAALNYREERGIVRLLAYRDGPVVRPDWTAPGWFNVSSSNFDFAAAFTELESLIDGISPVAGGMIQGQLRNVQRQTGIDVKRDFVGSLGTSMLSALASPADAPAGKAVPFDELDQLFAVSLRDATGFERAVDTLKQLAGPKLEQVLVGREYLGRKLYEFKNPNPAPAAGARGFCYAIADGWLLVGIGGPGMVETALQRMGEPRADSFWEREDVRRDLAGVPPAAFSVQHQDGPRMLSGMFSLLVKVAKMQSGGVEGQAGRMIDPEALPKLETLARYWAAIVSHGERSRNGFQSHTVIQHPAP